MSTASDTGVSAESRNTRQNILDAALEIFAERGFDGAKTRDIAERAGANLGLIKYYFDTKENLWKTAVDLAFTQLSKAFGSTARSAAAGCERDQLEDMTRRLVHFAAAHPHFIQLMNDEGKRPGPRMRWLVQRHVKPLYRDFSERLERLQKLGIAPMLPAPSFHYILVGAACLIFSQAAECEEVSGVDPTRPEVVKEHADALVQLLLGRR
ncbi:MAG: TetR/AcrR family transcriptional regulator [bacterium]|nr:TetR/AcrR family transcriptional regulator [bacterium]